LLKPSHRVASIKRHITSKNNARKTGALLAVAIGSDITNKEGSIAYAGGARVSVGEETFIGRLQGISRDDEVFIHP